LSKLTAAPTEITIGRSFSTQTRCHASQTLATKASCANSIASRFVLAGARRM